MRLEPLLDYPGVREFQVQWVLPQLAWAYLERGDEHRATILAAQSEARARAERHDFFLVDALRVQAMVAMRQSSWQEAQEALEESIGLCRSMPYPYAEAKALYVYGRLQVAKGEPEQARENYQAALVICKRLGEGLYKPYIERALDALHAPDSRGAALRATSPRRGQP
jgi:tetratricopeptide (TPR) repeat protein